MQTATRMVLELALAARGVVKGGVAVRHSGERWEKGSWGFDAVCRFHCHRSWRSITKCMVRVEVGVGVEETSPLSVAELAETRVDRERSLEEMRNAERAIRGEEEFVAVPEECAGARVTHGPSGITVYEGSHPRFRENRGVAEKRLADHLREWRETT